MDPDEGSINRIMERPKVVLPQPDSPTSPNVSPLNISKFVTACISNKLSAEAIQAFILASKEGLSDIDQALKMNIATNKLVFIINDLILNAK